MHRNAGLAATDVARLLEEIGDRMSLQGGNPHRARAYLKAADSIRALPYPLAELIAADRLEEIPGVGKSIASVIAGLQATGTHPALEALRSDIPPGVLELLRIPGIRPEQALALFRDHGI